MLSITLVYLNDITLDFNEHVAAIICWDCSTGPVIWLQIRWGLITPIGAQCPTWNPRQRGGTREDRYCSTGYHAWLIDRPFVVHLLRIDIRVFLQPLEWIAEFWGDARAGLFLWLKMQSLRILCEDHGQLLDPKTTMMQMGARVTLHRESTWIYVENVSSMVSYARTLLFCIQFCLLFQSLMSPSFLKPRKTIQQQKRYLCIASILIDKFAKYHLIILCFDVAIDVAVRRLLMVTTTVGRKKPSAASRADAHNSTRRVARLSVEPDTQWNSIYPSKRKCHDRNMKDEFIYFDPDKWYFIKKYVTNLTQFLLFDRQKWSNLKFLHVKHVHPGYFLRWKIRWWRSEEQLLAPTLYRWKWKQFSSFS